MRDNTLRPDSTFDRFVATTGSRNAYETAKAFAAHRRAAPRLLLFYGPPGAGKTHLLHSILHAAGSRLIQPRAHMTALELVDALIARMRNEPIAHTAPDIARAAMLAIDDLHVLAGKPVTQREIGRLLTERVASGTRAVCAATCELEEIGDFAEMLRGQPTARMIAVRRPNDRALRRILAGMAVSEELDLGAARVAEIAGSCDGDVRRAAGALTRERFQQRPHEFQ